MKKSFLIFFICTLLCVACSNSNNKLDTVIKKYYSNHQIGTIVYSETKEKYQYVENATINSNTICIITNSDGKGWILEEGESLFISYNIDTDIENADELWKIGLICNGRQEQPWPYLEADGHSFSITEAGEYYLYFENSLEIPVTVNNCKIKIEE